MISPMAIWISAPVEFTPEVELVDWRVYRTADDGSLHLVGARRDRGTGRISSPVTWWDLRTRCALTSSGRTYQLLGAPGRDSDAHYV